MPCPPEIGGPSHPPRRQASRRAAEARRPAHDHREGAGGLVGHVGGVGGRTDYYAALSAGVTREEMASAANSFARASATHDVICGSIAPPRERSASASRRFS